MGFFRKRATAEEQGGRQGDTDRNLQQPPPLGDTTREGPDALASSGSNPMQGNAWLQRGIAAQERGEIDQAIECYLNAARAGNRDAMFNLGNRYADLGKTDESVRWYSKAADAGDDDAMLSIAVHHFRRGADDDAIQWYRRAQAAGNRDAGAPLELLEGTRDGDADAAFQLGAVHMRQGNREHAIRCWTLAHEAGHHEAAYDLGVIFQQRGDRERALHWYAASADTGYTDALTGLMQLMSMEELLEWLEAAIDRGNPVARDFLAQLREGDAPKSPDYAQERASERTQGGATPMSRTVEEWEEWIEQRLDAEPERAWQSTDVATSVTADMAGANLLLIELLAGMTPRSSLSKFHAFISDAATSPEGNLRLRIMSDVMWAVRDSDDGSSNGNRDKAVSANDAPDVPQAAGLLYIFLHSLAAPNGVTALGRATQQLDEPTGSSVGRDQRALRAKLYIALVDMISFEKTMPPMPAEVLNDFR